ncbi:glucose-1-phosphate adenylyltransferase subunit GlgD [Candidatus Formimonas warabiya]|uniref:Glucose-1-phosphate adenylyltransferase subunit GlgD n=1 Tax=Formimonas warabiya TaxID=1761012 RepID=A0A3G1L0B4_FORW1|nr:glucose-1-phosphate adenylyltransferase subunit GlgD [Candidatus Formimonas warabiya]ATW28213.1 glucose-1-phosphate adenylyltransferase subunit GlgD [Candidatus Formimonas warabiya]
MFNVLGIINVIEKEQALMELTENRTLAAVPIGGRYRIIDFTLSNMVNAGIKSIGIFTHFKMGSLVSHLKNSREWNLDTKRRGLFFLPPDFSKYLFSPNKWDVSHFTTRLGYMETSTRQYVIISGCNMVCNIDYQKVLDFHQKNGADITVIFKEVPPGEKEYLSPYLSLDLSTEGQVTGVRTTSGRSNRDKICMEMFLLSRTLLLQLIDECVKQNKWDLVRDGFMGNLRELKIYGYPFTGYLAKINSLRNYYKHSMDLLKPPIWQELFFAAGPVFTKVKDSAPAKYTVDAAVTNALVANDCVIGGRVENSVISRGVKIGKGARVSRSILLEKCVIEENALVENAILDKEVRVTKGKIIGATADGPTVVRKKSVL